MQTNKESKYSQIQIHVRDKQRDGWRRSTIFGLIPLISSSKVWFMDTDGLKIVLNIV